MSRFLVVSLPLAGHVNPIAAVARVLTGRGHEVAWAGSERFLRPLLGAGALIHPIPLRAHRGGQGELGMAAAKSRWEGYVVPHARYTLRAVDRAAADFEPDVMLVDQHAVAGALVAHKRGLTWASVAPTTMELTRPYRALPKVESWLLGLLDGLWADAGLPGRPPHDLRFSPHLLIAFTGSALTGELSWPQHTALVGPAIEPRPADAEFPWDWLDPARKHLLVTVGTLSMDQAENFYHRMTSALEPLGSKLQAIVIAPEYAIPDPSPHVLVRQRVPMLDLMPRLDAVVSHGGLNTVCEALAHGLPLVVAPIKGDQPINAAQVAAAGAGVRVRFARARPETLRDAVLAVLDDPSYRAAAEAVRASFRAAGGAPAAADLLEALALRTRAQVPALNLEVVHEGIA
ncbi:MAG TPA: nucleotide disphospho-sugar-binding domain-containing protein [Actinocrinis sp.]|uniref:glycosyltransferase n=1 Tax=Actinocrinis sp. TaxID=1920516 RepID=UPI002DDCCD38|nr:nucleotide disphospho-sugar-binding domain-containing protein [Actinocrinis sp.]HEV3171603.1 nucleotide disphospho-sugar-binding domain-containing protein [Actinocrinis sp.]